MATEKQIEANRKNAKRSTGPRSVAGKARIARNAFRHGLSTGFIPNSNERELISNALLDFMPPDAGEREREYAEAIASAHLELQKLRRIKVALINYACLTDGPETVQPNTKVNHRRPRDFGHQSVEGGRLQRRQHTRLLAQWGLEQIAEGSDERELRAIIFALPELNRLNRYERRARVRRDRALSDLAALIQEVRIAKQSQ
jgi:hypothetical protein